MRRDTVTAVAHLTGVPARTIRNWIGDGRITVEWHKGKLLVDQDEIEQLSDRRGQGRLRRLPPGA